MKIRQRLESLIDEMLGGRILLDEVRTESKRIYMNKASGRNGSHISNTARSLGVHHHTLSRHIAAHQSATVLKKNAPAKLSNNRKLLTVLV